MNLLRGFATQQVHFDRKAGDFCPPAGWGD
jgi:hypothetical protein